MASRRVAKDLSVQKKALEALPSWLSEALTSIDPSDAINPIQGVVSTGGGLLGRLGKLFQRRAPMNMSPEFKPAPGAWEMPAEFAPVEDVTGAAVGKGTAIDEITKLRQEAAYRRVLAAQGKPQGGAVPVNQGDSILRNHELPGKDRPVKRKGPRVD